VRTENLPILAADSLLEEHVMTPPDRLRALFAEPGFVVMPAMWDGLSANLSAAVGLKTTFLFGSCVAASRLDGPDLAACRTYGLAA
jgi:2-methylisocitrate lyase-like PEP mutase family enzyme